MHIQLFFQSFPPVFYVLAFLHVFFFCILGSSRNFVQYFFCRFLSSVVRIGVFCSAVLYLSPKNILPCCFYRHESFLGDYVCYWIVIGYKYVIGLVRGCDSCSNGLLPEIDPEWQQCETDVTLAARRELKAAQVPSPFLSHNMHASVGQK